jgi:zinc protease
MLNPFKKITLGLLIVLMAMFASINASAQTATDKLPLDPNVKIGKLPNGLTYYIRKNTRPEKKVAPGCQCRINSGRR